MRTPKQICTSLICLLGVVVYLGACARVRVTRITGENEASATGFRYYLPRPYLALTKPVVVAGDVVLTPGEVSERGDVLVDELHVPEHVKKAFRWDPEMGMYRIGVSDGLIQTPLDEPAQGADATSTAAGGDEADKDDSKKTGEEEQGADDKSKLKKPPKGGNSSATGGSSATEVPSAGSVVPLGDPASGMSIVYLPDWEEQYAISYRAGFGRVSTGEKGLRFRHGWMLDNVSLEVDNQELGKFIFGQIDKFTDVASLVSARKNKVLAAFAGAGPDVESEAAATGFLEQMTGRTVMLRISYVLEAQPGLYPLLKPSERFRYLLEQRLLNIIEDSRLISGADWLLVPYPPTLWSRSASNGTLSWRYCPRERCPKVSPNAILAETNPMRRRQF